MKPETDTAIVGGTEASHPEFHADGQQGAGLGDGGLARQRRGHAREGPRADQLQGVATADPGAVIDDAHGGGTADIPIDPVGVAAADQGSIGERVLDKGIRE